MENHILITTRKDASVTDEQLFTLFSGAYDQWRDNSLDYPFLHIGFEKFQRLISHSMVTVAVDTTTGSPVGMRAIACYPKKRYAYDYFLSIAPQYKRQGIATKLMAYEKERLRQKGYSYVACTTSAEADWSVRWHRKMGYLLTGYHRSPEANAPIYSYRLQLASSILWGPTIGPLTARLSYTVSYLVTLLLKHSDGRDNLLGKVARKIKR
jgi:ribosomal protein S18 acetylase RimI-like enzyme